MDNQARREAGDLIREAMSLGEREMLLAVERIEKFYGHARAEEEGFRLIASSLEDEWDAHFLTLEGSITEQGQRIQRVAEAVDRQESVRSDAVAAAQELRTVSDALGTLSTESTLLAVNAKVQAAHLGNQMQAVQVIATAIRDLSKNLDRCCSALEEIEAKLKRSVPTLAEQTEVLRKTSANSETAMSDLRSAFSTAQEDSKARLQETISQASRRLRNHTREVHQLVASLMFFDRITQLLNAALLRLGADETVPSVGVPSSLIQDDPELCASQTSDDLIFL